MRLLRRSGQQSSRRLANLAPRVGFYFAPSRFAFPCVKVTRSSAALSDTPTGSGYISRYSLLRRTCAVGAMATADGNGRGDRAFSQLRGGVGRHLQLSVTGLL